MTPKSPEHTALFPGTFNPFTIGHKSIADRALKLFDRLIIAVGINTAKNDNDISAAKRVDQIKSIFKNNPRITVISYSGLTVDACKHHGATVMIRGVRSVADFEYERNLADINLNISGIETVLLTSLPELSWISSSMVRELRAAGHDVSRYLPLPDTDFNLSK